MKVAMMLRVLVVITGLLISSTAAFADSAVRLPVPISVTGIGSGPIALTAQQLDGLPVVERDVTFQTSKGPSSGHYKGVLVWDLLTSLKAFEGLQHNAELNKTFLVKASDGYAIAFSVGEIHPDFGNTPLILATEIDGKPVENGWRFVVPGDKRGARAIHDITSIELR